MEVMEEAVRGEDAEEKVLEEVVGLGRDSRSQGGGCRG